MGRALRLDTVGSQRLQQAASRREATSWSLVVSARRVMASAWARTAPMPSTSAHCSGPAAIRCWMLPNRSSSVRAVPIEMPGTAERRPSRGSESDGAPLGRTVGPGRWTFAWRRACLRARRLIQRAVSSGSRLQRSVMPASAIARRAPRIAFGCLGPASRSVPSMSRHGCAAASRSRPSCAQSRLRPSQPWRSGTVFRSIRI